MKGVSWIAAFAFAGAAEAAAADLAADSPRALQAALARAGAGDRILLAPGWYGDFVIGPRKGAGIVTIEAARAAAPPTFRSIFIRDADDVSLRRIAVFFGGASNPLVERAVEVRRSADIRLEALEIKPGGRSDPVDGPTALVVRDSRRVTLTGSAISNAFRGVVVLQSDQVIITRTDFKQIGSDGVAGGGVMDLTVANNTFSEFSALDPVKWHPDAIQLWSRGARRANERIVIRNNVIRRGGGDPTQGVFIRTPEIASRAVLIEGNRIEQSMGQGILVQNAIGVTIRNNTLIAVEPVLHPPAIEVRAPFEGAVVENNQAPKFRLPATVDARGNLTLF